MVLFELARQSWTTGEVYADQALSGASRFRPAFQQMLADAEQRRFDVIVVEALDRLSGKLADVADLHDRLSFLRIGLHTVATGEITPMPVGMLGTMAQMYLKDLAEKTRRGQHGGLDVALHGDLAPILRLCEVGACKNEHPGTDVPGAWFMRKMIGGCGGRI